MHAKEKTDNQRNTSALLFHADKNDSIPLTQKHQVIICNYFTIHVEMSHHYLLISFSESIQYWTFSLKRSALLWPHILTCFCHLSAIATFLRFCPEYVSSKSLFLIII